MNIKSLLEKFDKDVISEETATAIAEAFESAVNEKVESRVNLEVENAVAKIDEDHAAKLETLLKAIDADHSIKLERVVEAITENHTEKLEYISSFYKNALNEKAETFSTKIIDEVSNFLDIALEKAIPTEQLTEAVNNTNARKQLETIRELIGVSPEDINSSVKGAITEGKTLIDELNQKLNESYKENETLLEKIKNTEAKSILVEKTKGFASAKKDFVFKLLNDKDSSYIQENFNYVVEMFERSEEETAVELVAAAKSKSKTIDAKVPAASTVLSESTVTDKENLGLVSEYLNELKRK
jgi:hypothetical protein